METLKIFCMYDRRLDADIEKQLNRALCDQGYEVSDISSAIENGHIIQEKVREIILQSQICIFVYGENITNIFEQEIMYASDNNKTVIAFIKDNQDEANFMESIPLYLRRRQAFYFWKDSCHLAEKALRLLQNYLKSPVQRGMEFENLVADIFSGIGWDIQQNYRLNGMKHDWDMIGNYGDLKCYVEVKAYRKKYMEISQLKHILDEITGRHIDEYEGIKVLVLGSIVKQEHMQKINSQVVIVDFLRLLFLVENIVDLKERLLAFVDYTIDDIKIDKPDDRIILDKKDKEKEQNSNIIQKYINEIKLWDVNNNYSEYEKICIGILKELFIDDLSMWKEQKRANDDLYRFDLICKIKDDKVNPFWKFIEDFFNTKYIIFEFKNYREPITQKEIYTTEKYLYAKALRGVAIIVSCFGTDKNAEKAIKGVLRENGKLIISISNEDVVNMLESKLNNEEPSDYLYTMLDNMLVELEK